MEFVEEKKTKQNYKEAKIRDSPNKHNLVTGTQERKTESRLGRTRLALGDIFSTHTGFGVSFCTVSSFALPVGWSHPPRRKQSAVGGNKPVVSVLRPQYFGLLTPAFPKASEIEGLAGRSQGNTESTQCQQLMAPQSLSPSFSGGICSLFTRPG